MKRTNLKLLYLVLIGLGAPLGARAFDESVLTSDTLFIEAEDADYGHGLFVTTNAIGMTGPYDGGSYAGLGDPNDLDFDWHVGVTAPRDASATYRPNTGLTAGKSNGSAGNSRGTFTVKNWWTLGWNSDNDWENYTRIFPSPAKEYVVMGHLASGGNAINVQLDQITSGAGQDDTQQVKKQLGNFAPGRATAGWDSLEIFPLTDTNGIVTTVTLGGTNTLRLTCVPGSAEDMDYIAFIPARVLTNPLSITKQPDNRRAAPGSSNTVFSVGIQGLVLGYQWFKNGQPITGATGATYTPIVSAADDGAKIHVVAHNNGSTVTSSDGTLTVGKLVLLRGAREQLWYGHVRDDVESGSLDTVNPDRDYALPTFMTPSEQGSDYADKLSAIFIAPVSGSYVFFVNGDDDADLFLSTDASPATKQMICQEISWAGSQNWTGNDGGAGGIPEKRSDQWSNSQFPNGIPLVAGKQYYIEAAHHEGGGGDQVEATYKLVSEPDPKVGQLTRITPFAMAPYASGLDGAALSVTKLPHNVTAVEGRRASFSADATAGYIGDSSGASPGLFIQWQSAPKGSTTFTDIPGASGTAYKTGVLALTDDGAQYRVAIIAGDVQTNLPAATLTVLPDTFPPVPSVGSVKRNDGVIELGVGFDEDINTAGLVAGNFALVGGGTISSFTLVKNSFGDYSGALLDTTGLTPGSTYQLTVKNVADVKGNALPAAGTNVSFKVGDMSWANTGSPKVPGQVVPAGPDGFDVLNGGRQEWNAYDEATITYVKKTNDFDVKVQVIYAEPGSQWTRVGLMARNALNVGEPSADHSAATDGSDDASAYAQTHVNPTQTVGSSGRFDATGATPANQTPNNGHEQNARLGKGLATTSWGSGVGGVPNYPDVWLRLQRQGANLHGYRSSDGVTWTDQGTATLNDQQPDMYVGPFLAIETGNVWASADWDVWDPTVNALYDHLFVAQFRNFGDVTSGGTPFSLSVARSGSSVVISWTVAGALLQSSSLGASANWTAVAGAPNTPTGGSVTVTPSGAGAFYRLQQ